MYTKKQYEEERDSYKSKISEYTNKLKIIKIIFVVALILSLIIVMLYSITSNLSYIKIIKVIDFLILSFVLPPIAIAEIMIKETLNTATHMLNSVNRIIERME